MISRDAGSRGTQAMSPVARPGSCGPGDLSRAGSLPSHVDARRGLQCREEHEPRKSGDACPARPARPEHVGWRTGAVSALALMVSREGTTAVRERQVRARLAFRTRSSCAIAGDPNPQRPFRRGRGSLSSPGGGCRTVRTTAPRAAARPPIDVRGIGSGVIAGGDDARTYGTTAGLRASRRLRGNGGAAPGTGRSRPEGGLVRRGVRGAAGGGRRAGRHHPAAGGLRCGLQRLLPRRWARHAERGGPVHRALRGDRLPVAHGRHSHAVAGAPAQLVDGDAALAASGRVRDLRLHAVRQHGLRRRHRLADEVLRRPAARSGRGPRAELGRIHAAVRLRRQSRRDVHAHDDRAGQCGRDAAPAAGDPQLCGGRPAAGEHHVPSRDPAGVPGLGADGEHRSAGAPADRRKPMTATLGLDEIPGPKGLPLLGNVRDLDLSAPIDSLLRLAREYGQIYKLSTPAGDRLVVSGADLVADLVDDARFDKLVTGGLSELKPREGESVGLFSSRTQDPLWKRAHNILMAPFSLQAMRDYTPKMVDIAEQLVDKWARLNPGEQVEVTADMTRLTLDTIALCGFSYRFNSFYRDTQHPFVKAMYGMLAQAQARLSQLPVQTRLKIRAQRQLDENRDFMNDLVDRIIAERRAMGDAAPTDDLLGRMLTGVDKASGEGLPDHNIRAQCITFLVAGHETTSGLLSFTLYYLLKNPRFMERARAEADEVLGTTAQPSFEQVQRLRYTRQVLQESLRLQPTVPVFNRAPYRDEVIGGRWAIPAGTPITVFTPALHRDPSVWGPDAEEYDPDHMAPERMADLPPHLYLPFGTGQRACIGRQFALQEATLVLGMLLQRFELVDHLDYQLHVKTALTTKPEDFTVQVRPRAGGVLDRAAGRTDQSPAIPAPRTEMVPSVAPHGTRLSVLFGSNLGTAEALATRLVQEGTGRGFDVTLGPLDEHVDDLPRDGALLVGCTTYNGTPPDNAAAFVRWLRQAPPDAAAGVTYSVFGCGSSEWASTYQAVPSLLDEQLAAHGGRRIGPRAEGDAAGDFDAAYRGWHGDLWPKIVAALGLPDQVATSAPTGPRLSITLTNRQVTNPVIVSYRARPGRVRANRELLAVGPGGLPERSTRHLEIALPDDISYRAGDHLGVLPRNGVDLIRRVMARFGLDAGQYLTIIPISGSHTHLPIDEPAPLLGVLGSCVELQDVAGRDDIATLADHTGDPAQQAALRDLVENYAEQVLATNRSLLDLVEAFPACDVPFAVYLDMLPPLRPRYYSISSSPMAGGDVCSITVGVVRGPARSGTGTFTGVGSGHLAVLPADGTIFAFVRPPSIAFRPPENPHTPMIMVGAGTGLAPFRGFLQERAALKAQGVPVERSLLFFGCRDRAADYLYADELRGWEADGIVRVEGAFSRADPPSRYVQDALLDCADEVWELLQQGAAVFVCGNAATMAPGVRSALMTIFR